MLRYEANQVEAQPKLRSGLHEGSYTGGTLDDGTSRIKIQRSNYPQHIQ